MTTMPLLHPQQGSQYCLVLLRFPRHPTSNSSKTFLRTLDCSRLSAKSQGKSQSETTNSKKKKTLNVGSSLFSLIYYPPRRLSLISTISFPFVKMVKIANTGSWLLGLLAIAVRSDTLVRATNNIVEGAFIVEYEDGFVSKLTRNWVTSYQYSDVAACLSVFP